MTALQLLPDNILRTLVCQECFLYLSVPPTTKNNLGDTICGRCYDFFDCTRSFHDTIAAGFLFKCINHYNGCNELINPLEVEKHEDTCVTEKQECFFCSFYGVLSQILNHSIKLHPENVSYDGKLDFFLNDMSFQKKIMFILNDNIFLITISATQELFTVKISNLIKNSIPVVNQFGVKFFKPKDTTHVNYLHTDYVLLDANLTNYFEKGIHELTAVFGSGAKVCCQILVGQFSLERELEFKQKFRQLSQREEELNNLKEELLVKEQTFLQQTNVCEQKLAEKDNRYNSVASLIKTMSWNFRCYSCKSITLAEMYFCPKKHFYCKICVRNICGACESVQEFKQLDEFENCFVSCDWPGCEEASPIKNYIDHKISCVNRPYKCPKQNCCKLILSLESLVNHWHCPFPLSQESSISCEIDDEIECYWVVGGHLYHVVMSLSNAIGHVLIEEIDVLPNNTTFMCQGRNQYGHYIRFSDFCGKNNIDIEIINKYYSSINIYTT